MAPMTRAERQAHTRARLIGTARDLFLADGYAATSLDKVAEAAGYSKGAVYSNFSGKEELCLAVLDQLHAEQVQAIVEAFGTAGDLGDKIDAFADWVQVGLGRPRWTALEVEFAAAARHSPFVAAELSRRHKEMIAQGAMLVEQVASETGIELGLPAEDVALALLSLGIGLGALRSLDSSVNAEVFPEVMRLLVKAAETD